MKTKALIINFNRLTLPRAMAEYLADAGCEPVFIDNLSTYEPLLSYYNDCPFQVIRMAKNFGHTVVWDMKPLLSFLGIGDRFIMTDPDLDLSAVPNDFLNVLNEGLDKYVFVDKCGLSLEVKDLPETEEGKFIRNMEAIYWAKPLDNKFYLADTDTTLALYRWPLGEYSHSALRTKRPYTAKHVPWYYANLRDIPEDEKFYFETASGSSSGKARLIKY